MVVFNRTELDHAIKTGDILSQPDKLNMILVDDYFVHRIFESGHLPILKWIHGNGHAITYKMHRYAVEVGNMSMLTWLWDQRKEFKSERFWDTSMCSTAAEFGHLHVLQWLRTLNPPCPWDIKASNRSVMNGHLTVLEWIFGNTGEWDPYCGLIAAEYGHVHILQWAYAKGLKFSESLCSSMAITNGRLNVLQWLHDKRFLSDPFPNLILSNPSYWLNMIKWFNANGYLFHSDHYYLVMQKYQLYYWVRQYYPETLPTTGFWTAFAYWTTKSDALEYVIACKWIQEHDHISWSDAKTKWIQSVDCHVDTLEIPSCLSYLIKCYI